MRLVSLVPSITETLLAWGCDVVGCTRFCEQPQLAHVGGTKDPQIEAILALRPDLVLVDREENRREDADAVREAGVAMHVTHVTALDQVETMLDALARAVGQVRPAVTMAVGPTEAVDHRRTAFVPIWRRPWMTIARTTYASTLLESLGIDTLPRTSTTAYPAVELDEIAVMQPDLVLLPSEPYPFAERHVAEVERTVAGARVVLVDGQDLFWWGVRTWPAVGRLRDALREEPLPR